MNLPGVYKLFNEKWSEYQTVWIISDTHFGDAELTSQIPKRPTDEEFIKIINSKVGKKDILIHLGDVGDPKVAKKLKGYKILIKGNHDRGNRNYNKVFNEIYEGPLIIGEKIILSHEPVAIKGMVNLHGHNHNCSADEKTYFNFCADVIDYTPVHFNSWLKKGYLSKIETIHRKTINKATEKKKRKKNVK